MIVFPELALARLTGSAVCANAETTTLYRAVSAAEYNSILQTGKFSTSANSLTGKFFAESAADAAKWGAKFYGEGKYFTVEAVLPSNVANQLIRWERLDGIGPARYAELNQLKDAVIKGASQCNACSGLK